MILLNLKAYEETIKRPLYFVDIASEVVGETGVRIVVALPSPFLKEAVERFSDVYAQHLDPVAPGAYTGSIPAELLKEIRVKGSLINHSEKRVSREVVYKAVERAHSLGLEIVVCAENPEEAESLSASTPNYIAIEPPELIGKGVSVSKAKPEVITRTVDIVKNVNPNVRVLCGAGVSDKNDVERALQLGTEGVLLASAFVKAKNPKEFLRELASVF
ncbi:MAG: triose-phosphate isomerase [Candidatus Bilamarchaeaceae archaeon]